MTHVAPRPNSTTVEEIKAGLREAVMAVGDYPLVKGRLSAAERIVVQPCAKQRQWLEGRASIRSANTRYGCGCTFLRMRHPAEQARSVPNLCHVKSMADVATLDSVVFPVKPPPQSNPPLWCGAVSCALRAQGWILSLSSVTAAFHWAKCLLSAHKSCSSEGSARIRSRAARALRARAGGTVSGWAATHSSTDSV